ncbi:MULTISPECIES: hypothetical protein [Aphanizomenonaceae]|uniref:Uncharacterized protein n=1 Tax=Dolichospermum heterosporum TAC447 TaxID=747523 RepID=A0ABY5LTP5_9CYAN|nr:MULTISPECIES: hypothetical protein [Aphanizomenonaceae]MBE9258125.1 hypothetical protein [Dolichospermum sp. LEGE 00246]UUO13918.1 hypothetical protein NG743_17910 [Dolichospermum heterosporum TAC447]
MEFLIFIPQFSNTEFPRSGQNNIETIAKKDELIAAGFFTQFVLFRKLAYK